MSYFKRALHSHFKYTIKVGICLDVFALFRFKVALNLKYFHERKHATLNNNAREAEPGANWYG